MQAESPRLPLGDVDYQWQAVRTASQGDKQMRRNEVVNAVATAYGQPPESSDVQETVAKAYTLLVKGWSRYPWWWSMKDDVYREEGGAWGVVYLTVERAVAMYLAGGVTIEEAVYAANREVRQELRRQHCGPGGGVAPMRADLDAVLPEGLDSLEAPPMHSEAGPSVVMVARLYSVATPKQKRVLDLLSQGLTQVEVARIEGVTPPAIRDRLNTLKAAVSE